MGPPPILCMLRFASHFRAPSKAGLFFWNVVPESRPENGSVDACFRHRAELTAADRRGLAVNSMELLLRRAVSRAAQLG